MREYIQQSEKSQNTYRRELKIKNGDFTIYIYHREHLFFLKVQIDNLGKFG